MNILVDSIFLQFGELAPITLRVRTVTPFSPLSPQSQDCSPILPALTLECRLYAEGILSIGRAEYVA
ncbi:unnamed protein product [Penicillium nalgiovense]|uniref:Uncharacterized protein n=1 Tax=Penicillium nalgiovense TaxID=60175 RepID=A0A9W4IP61_PENNA|nr:unnamed protein product [Penicillium nalgiovense]CAG7977657.1 unnamed protein product [Penicillium nalgiovense]CAG7984066.1 unnamed protein product [Penicillium nalgiovense]CAG7993268.1 unnamed protein product [Penicillium nalgiovense]CAG7993965.1 unnamed protein product [Penicillium nalgiovense]